MPPPALCSITLVAAVDNFVNVGGWLLFGLLVLLLVGVDLLVIHRKGHEPSMAESAVTVAVWILLAIGFNGFVWWLRGGTAGVQFATGYLLEWSLSMDNVFVFAVIFRFFQVPKEHQYRILFWGILGAVLMRLGFILAGAALIARFDFILPVFGLFSIYTSYRLATHSAEQIDPSRTLVFRLARRWLASGEGGERGAGSGGQGARSKEQGAGSEEKGTELPTPCSPPPAPRFAYSGRFPRSRERPSADHAAAAGAVDRGNDRSSVCRR